MTSSRKDCTPWYVFDKGEEPTIVHCASGRSSSKGLPVPCAHRSKLARTKALLASCTDADCSMIVLPDGLFPRGPKLAYAVRDLGSVRLQCKVPGIEHVKFNMFEIPTVRFCARRQEHEVVPAPDDQGGRLELPEVVVPLGIALHVASVVSVQDKLNIFVSRSIHAPLSVFPGVRTDPRWVGCAFKVLSPGDG